MTAFHPFSRHMQGLQSVTLQSRDNHGSATLRVPDQAHRPLSPALYSAPWAETGKAAEPSAAVAPAEDVTATGSPNAAPAHIRCDL